MTGTVLSSSFSISPKNIMVVQFGNVGIVIFFMTAPKKTPVAAQWAGIAGILHRSYNSLPFTPR